jgi:hypothetical protein
MPAGDPARLLVLVSTFRFARYFVLPGPQRIDVVLHVDASSRDIVQAYLQACAPLANWHFVLVDLH